MDESKYPVERMYIEDFVEMMENDGGFQAHTFKVGKPKTDLSTIHDLEYWEDLANKSR